MRCIVLTALCILWTVPTPTQTTQGSINAPISAVSRQLSKSSSAVAIDWQYEARQQMLTLHLVNNSGKDITAYNISITRKYSDGSAEGSTSENMEEMLGDAVHSQLARDAIHPQEGKVCGEAANGDEAITQAVALTPSLIILDINMPILGGFGAAKELKKLMPDVTILFFSTHESKVLVEEAKRAGVQGFVAKDQAAAVLVAAIAALDRRETFFR